MKKNIAVLLFIGIMTWIPIGSPSQNSHDDNKSSKVVVVSGGVSSHDGKWEIATFGLDGPASYHVYAVELRNESEGPQSVEFEFEKRQNGITWYSIDLKETNTTYNFNLIIHFGKKKGSAPVETDFFSSVFSLVRGTSPNDPDETVVILKYP
ncbi:MAG: hypothetical protein WC699_08620 [Bacteroidales bacterium]|jgi:hypothetical protein